MGFFDNSKDLTILERSLSLSKTYENGSQAYYIRLFQDERDRVFEFVCWFEGFEIRSPEGKLIPLEKFMAGGRRWWQAMRKGDPRTLSSGIVALKDDQPPPFS